MKWTLKDLVEFLKRYPIAIGCGLLSVIAVVGYSVRNSRASELGVQLKQVESQAQKILSNVHNAANLQEQYSVLTTATKGLESRLVRSTERARNQEYFYEIESEAGVKETSLQQGNIDPKKNAHRTYCGVGFTVSVEGNYRQILDFVGRLESGHYFCRMVSATVSRRSGRNASGPESLLGLTLNVEFLGLP